MKKNYQDISKKDFKQHNKSEGQHHYPSPIYPQKKLTEFEKLAYVYSAFYMQPKNNFEHATEGSLFQPVAPRKNQT